MYTLSKEVPYRKGYVRARYSALCPYLFIIIIKTQFKHISFLYSYTHTWLYGPKDIEKIRETSTKEYYYKCGYNTIKATRTKQENKNQDDFEFISCLPSPKTYNEKYHLKTISIN